MRLQRLIALSALPLIVLTSVGNAQNTQGPLPQPGQQAPSPGPLQPGGTADTATRSRLSRLGSIIGIDGSLFVVTALGLVALNHNNDPSESTTSTTSTTSTSGT